MKKVKDDEESMISTLPLWGLLFLVCALFQVFEVKDSSMLIKHRRGSVVKTVPREHHLVDLLPSWFDKEDNK